MFRRPANQGDDKGNFIPFVLCIVDDCFPASTMNWLSEYLLSIFVTNDNAVAKIMENAKFEVL